MAIDDPRRRGNLCHVTRLIPGHAAHLRHHLDHKRETVLSESILTREPPPADLRLHYGPGPQQFGDLRVPGGSGPHPCVIAIHGGFWRARYDLEHLGHFCAALTAAGLATWSIEYRRVGDPGGGWPGTFHDVIHAARFLFAIAPHYGIDVDRVIVAGHSAGGHLALWLAGLWGVPEECPIHAAPLPLLGAASLAGVLDLRQSWQLGLGDHAVDALLGGSPDDVPERYAAASPVNLLPPGMPQMLIHGTDDDIVPVEISETYHRAAGAYGGVSLRTLPRTGHFELIDPRSAQWPETLGAIRSLIPR
jgi:acetyl esterase/lipase